MFSLPYETTVASKLYKSTSSIIDKLKSSRIELGFPNMSLNSGKELESIYYTTPYNEHMDIPGFTQYLNIGTSQVPELIMDGRPYLRQDRMTQQLKVIAENDWQFQAIRMSLNLELLKTGNGLFNGLGNVPVITFSRWISGVLSSRYNLGIESQMAISVITALYYQAMINPELREAGEPREMEVSRITQITGVNPEFAFGVIDNLGPLHNLDHLCHELSHNSAQQRTGELKTQDLVLLLGSSWFGINARENVAISLEHLPTFVALVYMALTSSMYRRVVLTQRALTAGRDRELKAFTDTVFRLVSEHIKH